MAKKDIVVSLEFTDKGSAKIKKVVKDTERQLKGLGKSAKDSGKGFKKMGDEVKKSGAGMSKFKGILKSTAVQMAAGMGLMTLGTVAIRGIQRALSDTMNTGREFEREWANVTTMLTISTEATERMKWELIKLSPILGDTIDLAKGMYQVLSASIQPAKAIRFLGEAAKSAQAGVTTTATAVDALTTVINAYGMSAEDVTKVSDIMFQTVKRGKLTYEGMSGALGTVVPIAAQVGISFEDIAAAMATLTRQGIDVNTTTVQLRQVMVSVLKPTKEAADEAERLGLEFSAAAIRAKGLGGFLADVQAKTKGSSDSMTKLFGNVRALTGVMGLAGKSAEAFAYDMDLMQKASGATEIAFQKQMQSADFWMKVASNTVKKLQIALYQGLVGPFKEGITTSDDLEKSISKLIDTAKDFGKLLGMISKGAFGDFVRKIQKAADAFEILGGVWKSVSHLKMPTHFIKLKVAEEIAADFDHLGITVDTVMGHFKKGSGAVKELVEQLEEWSIRLEDTRSTLVQHGGALGLMASNIMIVNKVRQEEISLIYATSKTSDEAQIRVRAYIKTQNDMGKEIKNTNDALEKFKEKLKGLGGALKVDLEARLKDLTDTLLKYRKQLSPNSIITMTTEIKKLRIELGLQDEIVETVIPKVRELTVTFDLYKAVMAGANIETNTLGRGFAFLNPFLIKAAEGIKKISDNAAILGVKTIPMMESELKKSEKALEELMKQGKLAPVEIVKAVEQIIQGFKNLTGEVPKIYKTMLKENKKAASILADDWQKSLSTVGMLFGILGEQVGGTFGSLISTVGSGLQQAMELAKDKTKSFGDILGSLSPVIGSIGGAIGSMISGTTKNFAKLGASLGSTIGGMFGPVGKAIGSLAGGLLGGLFKKKKTPEEIAAEKAAKEAKILEGRIKDITAVMAKFGDISEETAKKIIESAKSMEGFAAESKHFADVIRDVGVKQSNINDLWERTQDIIHHVTDGFLDAKEGAKALGESFTLLLDGAKKLGLEGSEAMISFIRSVRESGLDVAEVTEYVIEQLDRIPVSLSTLIKGKGGSLEGLGQMASSTFHAMIANGRTYMESLKAMKGPLSALFDEYKKRGEELPGYLKGMADLMEKMELSPQVFENLDAATNVLSALKNSAYLTQGAFNELSRSAAAFAMTILGVKGNLDEALGSMTLTESQIQQLLPVVSQFVGAAALFGLGIPSWMKTFVTKQLGADWGKFQETVKAQAGAGIATVEALNKLMDSAIPDQTKSLREKMGEDTKTIWDKLEHARRDIYSALGGIVDAVKAGEGSGKVTETEDETTAQYGFSGTVSKPTKILVHPNELINITPMDKIPDESGGTIVFAPQFNLLDGENVQELVENKLFPEFLRLINSNKHGAKIEFRQATGIE